MEPHNIGAQIYIGAIAHPYTDIARQDRRYPKRRSRKKRLTGEVLVNPSHPKCLPILATRTIALHCLDAHRVGMVDLPPLRNHSRWVGVVNFVRFLLR
jgi:hypothetical protein